MPESFNTEKLEREMITVFEPGLKHELNFYNSCILVPTIINDQQVYTHECGSQRDGEIVELLT